MAVNEDLFPNLKSDYTCTSPPDERYNCIAWAAGVTDEWWDPVDGVWPDELPNDDSLVTLVKLYEGIGFDLCADGDLEAGFEKIPLYGMEGVYEHAARQLPNGRWTSKLGPDDDIEHPRADSLAGDHYGPVVHFLKRKRVEINDKSVRS
ncbi:MAG: hypothetical protein HYS13_14530 [Planctomycetia bacterium]|nr:hypothetical protein [Planctomycetia bacterium]